MRVGQYNGFTMSGVSSGTGKIGNVSLPDFNGFSYCTKTKPTMSDDKFKEAIIAQAKKDQAAGKYYTQAVKGLQKKYVSAVSPDRKKLITEGLTQIAKKPPQPKMLSLLDLIFGEVKYEKTNEGLRYAEFKDSDGNDIATYSNGEWKFYGTKEEISRESEFFSIYREAWGNAEKSSKNAT